MRGIQITRDIEGTELRRLARREKSGRVAARMLAIANVLSGMDRENAAKLAGMERQTLRDWVHRFNAQGIEGLRDLERPGRPSELDDKTREKLAALVEKGPDLKKDGLARWRRVDLQAWLKKESGVEYHETSVGRIRREIGFSRVSVRPIHPEADVAAQEAFKKTLSQPSQKSYRSVPKGKSSSSGSKMKRGLGKKVR